MSSGFGDMLDVMQKTHPDRVKVTYGIDADDVALLKEIAEESGPECSMCEVCRDNLEMLIWRITANRPSRAIIPVKAEPVGAGP